MRHSTQKISVDKLFPDPSNISGTRGKKLDISTIYSNTPLNQSVDLKFTSNILVDRIKQRRVKKMHCYDKMLRYCHQQIETADTNHITDIIFEVIESIPESVDYDPMECMEYMGVKLRQDDFCTTILTRTTMFITWKYIELKKQSQLSKK